MLRNSAGLGLAQPSLSGFTLPVTLLSNVPTQPQWLYVPGYLIR